MNDTVTILGRVGGDPNRSATTTGVPVVNLRVASPQRRFDGKTQSWIETGTNWYNVSAFRQLADHVKSSLHSGDAVIVTGRLKLREWESGGRKGLSADIEAEAIGHDLRWGASAFAKASRSTPAQDAPPADESFAEDDAQDSESSTEGGEEGDEASERDDAGRVLVEDAWSAAG